MNAGFQNLITIPHSSHRASSKNMEICMSIQHDAYPNHQTSAAIVVSFSDVAGAVAGPGSVITNDSQRTFMWREPGITGTVVRLFQTGNNLFWAIFGKGEPHFADIYNCQNKTNGKVSMDEITIDENRHYFTEAVGYGMWGMYHFIACLVILNMLIGMMAESYQRVQENADMEWKFACSTLWLSVFDVNCLVPPPFNLLPSIQWFMTQYKWMRMVGKGEKHSAYLKPSEKKESYIRYEKERSEKKCEDEKYEKLVVQLIRRYLTQRF
ncbi:Transient receptor potential-gamma protein [Araneus ventricosus]|uniref:Transient receptor potential-gamma protein n=1 Tax=Araneus ventricosus TaxID=182803 RepID=A0A4Y2A7Z3_ARAVE|nr:Transient receptor potential-gamma protein [Araneus ventricosus]